GVVTNVAAFGAFVDVGVHQDGLVHVSAMSHEFVSDPREVVKPGDVVKVKVLVVDVERKRISLTLRLYDEVPAGDGLAEGQPRGGRAQAGNQGGGGRGRGKPGGGKQGRQNRQGGRGQAPAGGAMADALRKAGYGG